MNKTEERGEHVHRYKNVGQIALNEIPDEKKSNERIP
jgi:Ser-tRNA(Ala) deacylase AlaX